MLNKLRDRLNQCHQNATQIYQRPENDPLIRHINNQQYRKTVLRICKKTGVFPSEINEDIINDNISVFGLF